MTAAEVVPERARCRWCAERIYKGPWDRAWKHSDTGKTTCVDLLGNDRRARPTRQYEEST